MPKAENETTTHPPLMSGAEALALLEAADQARGDTGPDAELIRLCAEFDALERASRASFPGGAAPMIPYSKEHDAFLASISSQQEVLAAQIVDIPPKTLEGFRAIARSVVLWAPDMLNDDFNELGGLHGVLNSALLRALTGEVRS